MNENEFTEAYEEMESAAGKMNLNWPRISGVAFSLFGQYDWPRIIMLIRDCIDEAQKALTREENPHQVVRERLVHYLTREVAKELDKGDYDDAA